MNYFRIGFFLATVLCLGTPSQVYPFGSGPSLQGFTGILNTPNAEVTPEKTFEILYTDQIEPMWRDSVPYEDSYIVSFGFLPYLELGARLTEAPGEARDLSANGKFQIPFYRPWLPKMAIGYQDIKGGAPHFRTGYAVLSQEFFNRVRLSLGYGIGPDRMEGVFGGAEVRLFDWLHLLLDHDAEEAAAGLRLGTPPGLLPFSAQLGGVVKTSLEDGKDETSFAAFLRMPIGRGPKPCPSPTAFIPEMKGPDRSVSSKTLEGLDPRRELPDEVFSDLKAMQSHLVELGFENVRVGWLGNALFVEYENSLYNHNELDGLGLVMGTALTGMPRNLDLFVIRILNRAIPVLEVSGPAAPFRVFFTREDPCPPSESLKELQSALRVRNAPGAPQGDIRWVSGTGNPDRLHSSLMIYPGLSTTVGTELGVFDYRLSVKPDLFVNLWKGAAFNLGWDIPVSWSEDFEEGAAFGDSNEAVLERIFLNQAFRVAPGLTAMIGGGRYLSDLDGVLGEALWNPGDGTHRFKARAGYFDDDGISRETLIGSYRYYMARYDLFFEAMYGQYLKEDQGFILELKRYFGDTAITFFVSNTRDTIGGIRITLPLTPRRDMKPSIFQVRGNDHWSYQLQSVLAEEGGRNPLVFGQGIIPQTAFNLQRRFFNADRLNEKYLEAHLDRLLDAYLFGKEKTGLAPSVDWGEFRVRGEQLPR